MSVEAYSAPHPYRIGPPGLRIEDLPPDVHQKPPRSPTDRCSSPNPQRPGTFSPTFSAPDARILSAFDSRSLLHPWRADLSELLSRSEDPTSVSFPPAFERRQLRMTGLPSPGVGSSRARTVTMVRKPSPVLDRRRPPPPSRPRGRSPLPLPTLRDPGATPTRPGLFLVIHQLDAQTARLHRPSSSW